MLYTKPTEDTIDINRLILLNRAELLDDICFDAVHILRNTSGSAYIYLLLGSGVGECTSCGTNKGGDSKLATMRSKLF